VFEPSKDAWFIKNPDTFGFEVSVVQRVAAGGRDGIIKACA